jgi:hypothetical protein
MDNKRKPVPAGGQPTPATIANADSTPPIGTPAPGATGPEQADGANAKGDADKSNMEETADLVEARVLVAFGEHAPDDIVTGSADAIEQMKLDGRADPHPDAIAYARGLQA